MLGPDCAEFVGVSRRLLDLRRTRGVPLRSRPSDTCCPGPTGRHSRSRESPGSVARMVQDAATFFDGDLSVLLARDPDSWGDVACLCST